MDFTITVDAPINVTIGDKTYPLRRFLLPAFAEWAEAVRQQRMEEILARYKTADEQAQRLTWWEPPIQDMGTLVQRARSPEGVKYVLEKCMKDAGVPDDVRSNVLAYGEPMDLMDLSARLTMSKSVADKLGVERRPDGMGESTGSSQPSASNSKDTSDASPATGAETKPGSDAPTPEPIPTA